MEKYSLFGTLIVPLWLRIWNNFKSVLLVKEAETMVVVAKRWKQSISLLDEWINRMWYTHLMKYYLILKEKKIVVHPAPWKNFEGIYYAKDEAEEDSLVWFYLFEVSSVIKFILMEGRYLPVSREKDNGDLFNGHGVLVLQDGSVLKFVVQKCEYT